MEQRNLSLEEIRKFGNLEFLAKQLVEGFITGLHKSPFHGFSVEFAEHRLYNPGESTRHMDWKVFGKTDRLYVKRFEEETNLRCYLVLDTSSSMYYPEPGYGKITFSVMAAASLAILLQRQKDAIGLFTFSEDIDLQTPVKSAASHVHKILLNLENLLKAPAPNRQTSAAKVIDFIAEKIHRRSLVIIFSDLLSDFDQTESLFSALQHLRHNGHDVVLFHVTDRKTESDFNFENRPYEFIDLESGSRLKLQPGQVREAYTQKMASYLQDLKFRAGQYKIDLVEVDIADGYYPILSTYLVKRAKSR